MNPVNRSVPVLAEASKCNSLHIMSNNDLLLYRPGRAKPPVRRGVRVARARTLPPRPPWWCPSSFTPNHLVIYYLGDLLECVLRP